MSKPPQTDQHTFLHVKQRLDHYRLPSSFPFECTGLLNKLLGMIDGYENDRMYEKENQRYSQLIKSTTTDCCGSNSTSSFSTLVDQAMKLQLSKHIRENNQLHLHIMTLKQQLSSLQHVLSKTTLSTHLLKHTNSIQSSILQHNHLNRENQLFGQLQDARYRYNGLIDLVHSEEGLGVGEKVYIKKLLKHKHLGGEEEGDKSSQQLQTTQLQQQHKPTRTRNVTTNDNNNKRQSVDNHHHHQSSSPNAHLQQQITFLKQKLFNRQQQILRLQRKLQFDGINMNRILKDFTELKAKEKREKVNERVEYLEKEGKQVKEENERMVRNGGDKQALRQHITKLTVQNSDLKAKLQKLKKKIKQLQSSQKHQSKAHSRKLNETTDKITSLIKQKAKQQTIVSSLQQKEQTLQLQTTQLQKELEESKEQVRGLKEENSALQQKLENERLMGEYERQKRDRRQVELTTRLNHTHHQDQLTTSTLLKQNQLLKQTINNLQRVNEEYIKRGSSFVNESTNIVGPERSVIGYEQQQQQQIQQQQQQKSQLLLLNEVNRQEVVEVKNRLYAKESQLLRVKNDLLTSTLLVDKLTQQLHQANSQHTSLLQQTSHLAHLQSTLQQVTQQLHTTKDLLQLQRRKCLKQTTQLSDNDKISIEFSKLKEQYFVLQKGEKERVRELEVSVAELEVVVNSKVMKIEERDARICTLQAEAVENSEKLRKANKELAAMDEEIHKVKMEKNRIDKKYTQLLADHQSLKSTHTTTSLIKQTQLQTQIQSLTRDLQKRRLLLDQKQTTIQQVSQVNQQLQRKLKEIEKMLDGHKVEVENYKQRQQLYQMEIRELRTMAEERGE